MQEAYVTLVNPRGGHRGRRQRAVLEKDFICKAVAGRLGSRSGLVAGNLGAWARCEAGQRDGLCK